MGVLVHRDESNVVVRDANVLVQLRWGALTAETIAAMLDALDAMRSEGAERVGVLVVLEPGAPPPPPTMRERQRQLIPELASRPWLHAAIAIPGEGVSTSLLRGLLPRKLERVEMTSSAERACRILAPVVGSKPTVLRRLVDEARVLADR
ncbi:MAG: hypothetical protein H6721_30095 [Sandaracinus sp.]|nr:hypothetical protein [Sandaracinus sp.]MCB9623182.1 hypothetical protein [Sandaracinus sp.]MCB9636383.1 hypothetical protein [Sandaracinus sp.]